MLPETSAPVPLNPAVPVAVRVHSLARLSPPLSLITVFFSVSTGALSLFTISQSADSPSSSSQRQIVLTCDRYPKEVSGLEERLKSRFGWGLTVAVEPPELETSVAILMSKAAADGHLIPEEVAFFIAQRIRSNVRELEGVLRRVIATSQFTGLPITLEFTKDALRDLLALQDRLVSIDNIQKTVAEYFKMRVADLHSKRRSRSITRPRQIAMALAKELTNHSLPEIGDAFGGRDHTTVLHACRRIAALRETETRIAEDYGNLLRTLTG